MFQTAPFQAMALVLVLLKCGYSACAVETLVRDVAEFDLAVSIAQPGDLIVMANGEWRDTDLRFSGKGEPDVPIVLTAQTPGNVVLTGRSRIRLAGENLIVRNLLWQDSKADDAVISFRIDSKRLASRCTLEHCAVLGDDSKKERKWVSIYGSDNVVERCWFEGKSSRGTLLVVWLAEGAGNHQIQTNFFGARQRLGKNGGEIIRIGDSETSLINANCVVEKNYFYRCDGEAEIISNKSCGNRYTLNSFVGCSGALTLRHGNRCLVQNNVFCGDGRKGTGGVRVVGEEHRIRQNAFVGLLGDEIRAAVSIMNGIADSPTNGYVPVRDVLIESNVFVDCKESFIVGCFDKDQQQQSIAPDNCLLANNRVFGKHPVFRIVTAPTKMNCTNNSYSASELGLLDERGWSKSELVEFVSNDAPNLQHVISETIGFPVLKPSDTGPAWKIPGDEYLPSFK